MAMTTTNQSTVQGAGVAQTLVASFSGIAQAFGEWRRARATAEALSGLSARQLDDIGLTAADVESLKVKTLF